MTCPTCGRPLPPGASGCPHCDRFVGFTVPALAQQSTLVPHARVRSLRGLGLAAGILTAITAVADTALTVASFWATNLERIDDTTNLSLALSILGLTILVSFASAVVTIIWLYQARRNIDAFPEARPRWGRGWAIGAWFVPVANVVLTMLVAADVARNSERFRGTNRSVTAVWIWGGLHVAGIVLAFMLVGELSIAPSTGGTYRGESLATIFGQTVVLATYAAQLAMIYLITTDQRARIAAPPAPAPV